MRYRHVGRVFLAISLILITLFASVISPITAKSVPINDGGTQTSISNNPFDNATRWTYYRGLSFCVIYAPLNSYIKTEDLNSGKIFSDMGSAYKAAVGHSLLNTSDGLYHCGDPEWIKSGFENMGFENMESAAVAIGLSKSAHTNGIYYWGLPDGQNKISIDKFRSAVAFYGNPENYFDDAAQYIQELRAFSAGCLKKSNLEYLKTDSLSEEQRESIESKYLYTIEYVDLETGETKTGYYEGKSHVTNVYYRINIDGNSAENIEAECYNDGGVNWGSTGTLGSLKDSVNSRVDAFADYIKGLIDSGIEPGFSLDDESSGEVGGDAPTCGSKVTGIGWIVCPVIDAMSDMNDGMWRFVENILFVNPLSESSEGVYEGWQTMRNLANIIFVIAFLIIIFSQLTGAGITNYGVKKMLPRVVIVAIAVNLSFILMQLAIDVTNILGRGLYEAINNSTILPEGSLNWNLLMEMILGSAVSATAGGLVIAGGIVVMGFPAALLALVPALLSVAVAWFAAVITLIFRQAAIPLLAMVAPLAFVAYLLPNTEQWFKRWYKLLLNMLMLYPMAALIFAGARFAGNVIIGEALTNGESFKVLMGLMVIGLPMFSLPFISRQGAPMLAKLNGALSNIGKRVTAPASDFSKELSKNAKVRADNAAMNNQNPGRFTKLRQRYLRFNARRGAINQNQQRELTRSQADYVAGEVLSNSEFAAQMAKGGGSGADSRARASAIKAQDDIHRQERDAETILLRNKDMATILKQAQGGAGITEAQQDAAMDHVMRNGDLGQRMDAISALTTSASERVRATAADGFFARKDHQVFGAVLGETIRAGGDGAKSVQQAVTEALDKKISGGNLSAAALASDERLVDEILGNAEKGIKSRLAELELSEDAVDNLAQQARAALESPNTSENLNAEYRAKLQAIADRASKLPS